MVIISARAWSHSTKDHFHGNFDYVKLCIIKYFFPAYKYYAVRISYIDEWGFLTVDPNGNATLMTAGNNGNYII